MVDATDRKTVARPLACCVLTISDSRTIDDDTSGSLLQEMLQNDGHTLVEREIVKDDIYAVRAVVSRWVADPDIEVIISSGGTGFTGRDSTPEALEPLLDKKIPGFGELFRQISYQEIGTSTVQSRAFGGMANATLLFALPGSTGACRTGWKKILTTQLDADHKPCNFAELIPRFNEH